MIFADDTEKKDIPKQISMKVQTILGAYLGAILTCAGGISAWFFIRSGPSVSDDRMFAVNAGVLFVCALTIFYGARMMAGSVAVRKDVIPPADRDLLVPLISEGNEKAIDQYVRLSSLTGGTGLATKLGLTGLPLLTVALTLIFSGLELYKPGSGFMDLTKLTLGAFIGSFVQRAATTQSAGIPAGRTSPVA
ncbi:hypothetical protein NKI96_21345 [Mesorhizobium sp. M0292]|uniref:hypothetical protein n=1 Tax=Mesorhizobium sp. M0292 TaxID=2956929 RepID=UPI00333B0F03